MTGKIKVLIADDHTIVRMGLSAMLETETDIQVVGLAKNGVEALTEAQRLNPDIVIMDLMMPKKDGVEATAELKEQFPTVKIIILTTFGTSDGIAHAIECGASGAVLKNAEDTELITAIRKVAAGGNYLSPEIKRQLTNDPPVPGLTPRQMQVLQSMTRGLTNRDIAKQLGIRQDGVNLHVNAILQKIGATNRTEAVAIALRKHLLKM